MTESPHCWALVPAAGSGRRMGASVPKQFLSIGAGSVLDYSVEVLAAEAAVAGIVLVGDSGRWPAGLAERLGGKPLIEAAGGRERCHSVLNGLRALKPLAADDDWVLVHDAARPCLRADDLSHLIRRLIDHPVGGLLAVPVSDTMKRAGADDDCAEVTLDRSRLWHAQTPQMFRLGALFDALSEALARGLEVTDEASAMEAAGCRPVLIEGHRDNIKITRPEDLALAEFFLRQQGRL